MQEPYYWYILFVRANTENRVIRDMRQVFRHNKFPYALDAFCPESEKYYRNKESRELGKHYLRRPLFPGYVFLETDMPEEEFIGSVSRYIYASQDIIRLLRYGSTDRIAMPEEERRRFEYLFRGKRCIEHSVGYIVGDTVHVEAGPLVGQEVTIKRIDRHNRNATVVIDILGDKREISLALEIVTKR